MQPTERQLQIVRQQIGREPRGIEAIAAQTPSGPSVQPQAKAFDLKVTQLKDNAFLNQIPQLKGMGALSNAEGDALRASFTYLNTLLPTTEFDAELDNIDSIIRTMRNRLNTKKFLTPEEVINRPYQADGATTARTGNVRTGTTSTGVSYQEEEE